MKTKHLLSTGRESHQMQSACYFFPVPEIHDSLDVELDVALIENLHQTTVYLFADIPDSFQNLNFDTSHIHNDFLHSL